MKRILTLLAALLLFIVTAPAARAEVSEFEDEIYSRVREADTEEIAKGLERIGVDPDEPETAAGLDPGKIFDYIAEIFKNSLSLPAKMILICAVFAAISQIASTLSYKSGLYGELFVLICFIALSKSVTEAFSGAVSAMKGCGVFMSGYVPALAAISAASGNISAAVSYNAIVLYFCEAAALLANTVLKPILGCMLVMSVTQALNPDHMNITSNLRNVLTTAIGFIMTLFLGVIGLQAVVGRTVDNLAVRAGKYAVSSFVPVIGYSLSESYKAVSLSLSAIRTSVGTFGIVVLAIFMLSPIILSLVYKAAFLISAWISRLMGADRIAAMSSGLADVFSFLGTVLTMFMLMLTVSTGMIIILGGEYLA